MSPARKPETLPAPSNPMAVARILLADYQHDDHQTLRRWRGGWMTWDKTRWTEAEETVIRSRIYKRLEHARYIDKSAKPPVSKPWEPNRRKVSDLADALTAITHLAEDTNPPSWLAAGHEFPADEIVACANTLLHVGTRKPIAHTPAFFNTTAVPFDYDPAAPEPSAWLRFLGELWPDDPDAVAALQQFFGYVLSGRTDLHKILLIIGPTRSGKGTIARVLTALIGKGNAAGPTLASLATNFGMSPLLGKPLAVVSDARLGSRDANQVVERLLSISGEDMLTVDRKYREPWSGKLPCRFVILSNELPRFGDASGAISHRFVVLTMSRSFLGRENTRLTGELLGELPGILRWSLDGLEKLTETGALTEPASSAEAVTALQDLVSPVSAFVRDNCDHGGQVPVADLFARWQDWCTGNGHKPGSAQTFGRDLRAVVPALRVSQPRTSEGTNPRVYIGLHLSAADNGESRVSARVNPDADTLTRADTRAAPLSAGVACPRHQEFGPHKHCRDCTQPADDGSEPA